MIESTAPMAVQSTHGLVPVDLALTEEGGAFKPKMPLVNLQISKQLSQGVSLANTGVSLIRVDEQGSPPKRSSVQRPRPTIRPGAR